MSQVRTLEGPDAPDRIRTSASQGRRAMSQVRTLEGPDAPDRIRTCDLWFRRPALYPTELRARDRGRTPGQTIVWSRPGTFGLQFRGEGANGEGADRAEEALGSECGGDARGLSPSNHGTVDARGACSRPCAPSFWQQRTGSNFLRALNSRAETFRRISYSSIYTNTDEVVVPNAGPAASSSLHGTRGKITNVAIQEVCPTDTSEHLAIGSYDNTAYQLAVDALTHRGPADPSRVSASVCPNPIMPGVDRSTFVSDYTHELAYIGNVIANYPPVPREPPLACYTTSSCGRAKG